MEQTISNSAHTGDATVQSVDEKITSFFHFDALLSAQYFDTLRRKTPLEPEKRLMLAVLMTRSIATGTICFRGARKISGCSTRPKSGSLRRAAIGYLALTMSVNRSASTQNTYAADC